MKRRSTFIDLPVAEIVRRYVAGETALELAISYGVSDETIAGRIREAGTALGGHMRRTRGGPLSSDRHGYLRTRDRANKCAPIHRGCWEAYHGPIPSGHAIHHTDGDRQHNVIENLECMLHGEHTRLHGRNQRRVR